MPGDTFEEHFGRAPTVVATAPGRVNLIGDHTDYNGGYVLPMPIPQHATFALAPRRDQQVHVHTAQLGQSASYRLGEERSGRGWIDYVQGLTWLLGREGHRLGGFDALLTSDVPAGAGLSSSAALEVALARALRELFGLGIDDVALALLSRRVETEFVGAPIGIMDQMASSLGEQGSALFLDTHCMRWERVPLPKDVEVVVIASGVTHSHAGGDYRLRRHECDEAARLLGVKLLRELEHEPERVQRLPEPLRRRALHVLTEDARVLQVVRAFKDGDTRAAGPLLFASHRSLRDDFEVSVPEIDLLIALAGEDPDVLGARMTGGGFGGSIVLLAREGTGARVARELCASYRQRTGHEAQVLVPQLEDAGGSAHPGN